MAYEALERAVVGLPDDKVNQLIDFALFLKQESQRRQRQHINTTSNFALDQGGAREPGSSSKSGGTSN